MYISLEDYIISSLTLSSLFIDSTRCSPSLSSRFSSIAFSRNSMPSREYLPLTSLPFPHKICRIEFSTSVKRRFTWIPFLFTPLHALPAANPRYSAACCSKTRAPLPAASPTFHVSTITHPIVVQLMQFLQLLLQIVTLTLQPAALLSQRLYRSHRPQKTHRFASPTPVMANSARCRRLRAAERRGPAGTSHGTAVCWVG